MLSQTNCLSLNQIVSFYFDCLFDCQLLFIFFCFRILRSDLYIFFALLNPFECWFNFLVPLNSTFNLRFFRRFFDWLIADLSTIRYLYFSMALSVTMMWYGVWWFFGDIVGFGWHCNWLVCEDLSEGLDKWRVVLGNQRERMLRAHHARVTVQTMLVISNATYASIWRKTPWSHSVVTYSVGHAFIGGSIIIPILRSALFARPSCRRRNWCLFMAGAKHRLIPELNHILEWRFLTVLRGRGRKLRRPHLLLRPTLLGVMGLDSWEGSFPWQLPDLGTSHSPLPLLGLYRHCSTFTSMAFRMPLSTGQLLVIPLGLIAFMEGAREGIRRQLAAKCSGRRTMFWRICLCWLDFLSSLLLFLCGNVICVELQCFLRSCCV